jgi:hypothetical protein
MFSIQPLQQPILVKKEDTGPHSRMNHNSPLNPSDIYMAVIADVYVCEDEYTDK